MSMPKAASRTRYTVTLDAAVAAKVERYAKSIDAGMSQAIATLALLGLETRDKIAREIVNKLHTREVLDKLKNGLDREDFEAFRKLNEEFLRLLES